ncbi:MAG: carbohydrate-binding family 9-like protein [Nannocystales bacterium]
MKRSLWALVVGTLLACGEPVPPRAVLEVDARQRSEGRADRWVFHDGAVVSGLVVPTSPVSPGESVSVAFHVSKPGQFEVSVVPPRAAAREVALGGPDAPPPTVPPDFRTRSVRVQGKGHLQVEIPVAAPWHPQTAIVTLRRLRGSRTSPVLEGPRRRDGVGVLAVLDVVRAPTRVAATRGTPSVDGTLGETLWASAAHTALVDSLVGEPSRLGATREDAPDWGPTEVAFAWDQAHLYVGAWLPDRDLRGTYTERDDPIWKQEVFELFVFGDDRRADYLELQVSPRGVQFDARFERYRKGDEAWNGNFAAPVSVRGTVEVPEDRDEGWTTEFAVPWSDICRHTEVECPVAAGMSLRVNAFRLERPRKGPTVGLALSPTRVPDFHAPENSAVLELLP